MAKTLMLCAFYFFFAQISFAQTKLSVDWNKIVGTSKTTPTLQVVENPMVQRSSPFRDSAFKALKNLGADYVRYVPWSPYPKLAVAELKPPAKTETFWDFTYLDSTMNSLMQTTKGHSVIINFSTTPAWMWETNKEVKYPDNPYQVFWGYNQGRKLRDTTCKELADYYGRLVSWYTKGGFTDEAGKYHRSGHHYKIPYWEVLNEPDFEHGISPQSYTKMYDAIVSAIRKVSPGTKFIGLGLGSITNPEWFEYFLNKKNHQPGIPIDGISYHHYSVPSASANTDVFQYKCFENADAFLDKVRYIEYIRKRLSPNTFTTVDEIGTIIHKQNGKDIAPDYWNLSGAMYAYLFMQFTKMGIDVAGESQLVGYPSQYPDVSMMDWTNGKPNARYWILKLLIDNFGKGDKLAATNFNSGKAYCQAYITPKGKKILLINRFNQDIKINLPAEAKNATMSYVNVETNEEPPAIVQLTDASVTLKPFSVAVIQLN